MIPALFQNAQFLLIAAALISVPIIIHLINRMRFKRIRWAAMEFLLKAQKRTRRRLIIEQLILLALRCLLIALVGLLVARFTGCGENNLGGKPNVHIVLVDDTLSMTEHAKGADGAKSCFDIAKSEFLIKKIAEGLKQSKTNDQVVLVPLSKLIDPEYKPKYYQNLNDPNKHKELVQDINELQPSMLNVSMLQGIKKAQSIMGEHTKSRSTLHILSDYRDIDWGGKPGEGLTKELLDTVKLNKEMKLRPIDTVHPPRAANQGSPPSRDNVGIVDFRPDTRVVGHKMPVRFTVTMANYSSKLVEVKLVVRNENTGKDLDEIDFELDPAAGANPQKDRTRIELPPGKVDTRVTFDYGNVRAGLFFKQGIPEGGTEFAHLSVRLTNAVRGPLDNDGILADNIRHTVVEVRDKVPILIVDGGKEPSRTTEGKDSFILDRALSSVPGSSYQVIHGDLLPGTGNDPAKALDSFDLAKYPTIYLVNVPFLTKEQIANLEAYVKNGGSVAFYMGPNVITKEYNEKLFRAGEGVFPVPLKTTFYPSANEEELPTKKNNDVPELITREDKLEGKALPIFSKMFDEPAQRFPLVNLPIHRYFKVDRAAWNPDAKRVLELATLPNDSPASTFGPQVSNITQEPGVNYKAVLANPEFAKYKARLQEFITAIEASARPESEAKSYQLANQLDLLLTDEGSKTPPIPGLKDLWTNSDDKVFALKSQLVKLREAVKFGDPFIITQSFGKGRVIAIMSTVGRDWNEWAGGSLSSVLFMPFVWEMQNYLSSPGEEGNLLVGTELPPLTIDGRQFQGEKLKLVRYFMKTEADKDSVPGEKVSNFGVDRDGKIQFEMKNHLLPGLYISKLYKTTADKELATFAHTFNVDTDREGKLARVGSEVLETALIRPANEITKQKDTAVMTSLSTTAEALVAKSDDLSESPWLFLILLLVLVAEQALAVHLSFHLKDTEGDLAPAGVKA